MSKKKNKKYDQYDSVISMQMFLTDYLGAENFDCKNLYHSGLKSLEIPLVVGISNDFALKNPEYVRSGEILKVIDAKGHIGTYINPKVLEEYSFINERKEATEKLVSKIRLKELKELNKLYEKVEEINKSVEKLDDYRKLIRLLTKNDHEAEVKLNAVDKASKAVQYQKKIDRMLAETND